jgi:NTP pyrophosphatase (non-canonical NTP hydrolase)
MELNEYQKAAQRTAGQFDTISSRLDCAALGIAGESGEIVNYIKQHLYHTHELNKERILLELGDTLWYIAELAVCCGFTLDDVAQANIEKLKKRYPNGFSFVDSKNRKE